MTATVFYRDRGVNTDVYMLIKNPYFNLFLIFIFLIFLVESITDIPRIPIFNKEADVNK